MRYRELLVENWEIFIPHLYLAPPQGLIPSEFREDVCYSYNWNDWATVWWRSCDDTLSRVDRIPERDGQTDGWTDRQTDKQNCYIEQSTSSCESSWVEMRCVFRSESPTTFDKQLIIFGEPSPIPLRYDVCNAAPDTHVYRNPCLSTLPSSGSPAIKTDLAPWLMQLVKGKVKERIVLSEIHLRTTGHHLPMVSHSVIWHFNWKNSEKVY